MSDSTATIKEQYDGLVRRLEAIVTDPGLLEARPDDCIFIDDLLLRLKLWAADIQYDQGSLEWAEKLRHISVPLRERLQQLDQQCKLFDAASNQASSGGEDRQGKVACHHKLNSLRVEGSEFPATNSPGVLEDARDNLRQAVDNLIAFTIPIKVAVSVPEAERTSGTISRANQDVTKIIQPVLSEQSSYIPLEKPLPIDQVDVLLGAAVIPEELFKAGARSDRPFSVRIPRNDSKVQVALSTVENFSMSAQNNRATSLLTSANPGNAASNQLNRETMAGDSTGTASYHSTTVRRWQLKHADEYLRSFTKEHRNELNKLFADSPKANLALVSVLLTARLPGMSSLAVPETGLANLVPESDRFDIVDHLENDMEQVFAFGCLKISDCNFILPKLSIGPGGLNFRLPKLSIGPGGLLAAYHIAPNFLMPPPPDGPLQLGSILTDLKTANRPINLGSPIPVPPDERYVDQESGFQSTSSGSSIKRFRFHKELGIAGASLIFHRNEEVMYRFDRLDTIHFSPTSDYVRQSMKQYKVRDYMKFSGRKLFYLVTGLKIARGAALIQNRHEHVIRAEIIGWPTGTESTVFNGSRNDFIFAIKASKIRYKSRFLGKWLKKPVVEDYNKGATMV